jgi:hypothetical protein
MLHNPSAAHCAAYGSAQVTGTATFRTLLRKTYMCVEWRDQVGQTFRFGVLPLRSLVPAMSVGPFGTRVITSGPAIAAVTRDLKAAATPISLPNSRISPNVPMPRHRTCNPKHSE